MAIICPNCGLQYDVTLFQFGKEVVCRCGRKVGHRSGHERTLEDDGSSHPRWSARIKAMIADDEVPKSVILREIEDLRSSYLTCFPGDEKGFEDKFGAGLKRLYRLARGEELIEDF